MVKLCFIDSPQMKKILSSKDYLRCKTITSKNVSPEAQVKDFFIS